MILVLEENNSWGSIVGSSSAPYINGLIGACGVATDDHNITHESLPNYLGMTSGLTLSQLGPYLNDCTPSSSCESSANNIFNAANTHGGWKAYAESMPSNCDRSNDGMYAARHNPAVYYTALWNCSTRDVPLGTLSNSPLLNNFARESTAPALSFVTPNLCDDMHGIAGTCATNLVNAGDTWLSQWLPRITSTNVYKTGDTAIVVVWDEGGDTGNYAIGENCATNTTDQSCHIPMIVVAPSVKPGTRVRGFYNHYSMMRTIEDLLGLPAIGASRSARDWASAFNL